MEKKAINSTVSPIIGQGKSKKIYPTIDCVWENGLGENDFMGRFRNA